LIFAAVLVFLQCCGLAVSGAFVKQRLYERSVQCKTISQPRIVLWAWTHDDDFSFIDSNTTAIAFYAGTIVLGSETATLCRRKNKLVIPKSCHHFPVFRIENAHPTEGATQNAFKVALRLISEYCKTHPCDKLQIDFDASFLDRPAYLNFLQALRKEFGDKKSISITALASWCQGDRWLAKAPVDEAVAMFFSLGKGKEETLKLLSKEFPNTGGIYDQSLGFSVSETRTNAALLKSASLKSAKQIYAFSSLGWTKQRYEYTLKEVAYE
jgi:hypothetical protein